MTSTGAARFVRATVAFVLSAVLVGAGAGAALADGGTTTPPAPAASISGTLTDAVSGAPIVGASVVVIDNDGAQAGSADAGSTGGYTVEGLAPGDYRISVSAAPLYEPLFWPSAPALDAAEIVTLGSGEARTGVDAALAPVSSASLTPVQDAATSAESEPGLSAAGDEASGTSEGGGDGRDTSVPTGDPLDSGTPGIAPLAANAVGSLSGTVTRADTGAPVSNVSVSASGSAGWGSTTTGADGTYTISGLGAGSYWLFFNAAPSDNLVSGRIEGVVLGDGEAVVGRDIALAQGGYVSGTVTRADTGAPLEGVDVYVSGNSTFGSVRTTADGHYRVSGIVGDVTVRFDPRSADPSLAAQYWTDGGVEPAIIALVGGQEVSGIDAVLQSGATISGRVTNSSTGDAVADVWVYASVYSDGFWSSAVSAASDDDGKYVLPGLAAGAVRLTFSPPRATGVAGEYWENTRASADADLITIEAGKSYESFDAALDPFGSISGRVTREDTGAPLAGVVVSLASGGEWGWPSTTTAADGSYTLDGVAPGTVQVSFSPPAGSGLANERWDGVTEWTAAANDVAVASGQTTTGIDASLVHSGSITGQVLVNGGPVDVERTGGVLVSIVRVDDQGLPVAGGGADQMDAEGRYSFDNLGPGRYLLQAGPWNGLDYIADQFYDGAASAAEATLVEVKPGEATSGVDFDLRTGIEITGTVTGAVRGAYATAYRWSGDSWDAIRRVSAWGDYSFSNVGMSYTGGVLPAGTYTVGFTAPGYCTQFWNGAGSLAAADTFTPAPGATQSGINATMSAECSGDAVIAGEPTIVGTPQVGETLTAQPGEWAPAPVELTYQWLAGATPIVGATSATLTLADAHVGKNISVRVTGSRPGYESASATSVAAGPVAAIPAVTAGTPVITGDTVAGKTLTATPGTWSPADATLSYQWLANNLPVAGATASTFVAGSDQIGKIVTVQITGTKSGYVSANAASAGVGPITAAPLLDLTVGEPVITGTPQVGAVLTVAPGEWGPAPVTVAYQWLIGGETVSGATSSTFALDATAAGKLVSVVVRGSKPGYNSVAVTADAVGPVANGVLATAEPTITGTPRVGAPLTANPGGWGPEPVSLTYQWLVDGVPVEGAVAATFTPEAAHLGGRVSVAVTGSKPGFDSATETSAPTGEVAKGILTTAPPTIVGTPTAGSALTVDPGAWGPAPVEFAYQWFADGQPIDGATEASFTPGAAEVGTELSVSVTGSRDGFDSATLTAQAAHEVRAPVALSASTAKPGDTVTVTGQYFVPGERVALQLHSDPIDLVTVTADESGAFVVEIIVPAAAVIGEHSVVATGESGRNGQAPLTVVAPGGSGTDSGAGSGGSNTDTSGGRIASTGSVVPIGLAILALALVVGGTVLVRRRSDA